MERRRKEKKWKEKFFFFFSLVVEVVPSPRAVKGTSIARTETRRAFGNSGSFSSSGAFLRIKERKDNFCKGRISLRSSRKLRVTGSQLEKHQDAFCSLHTPFPLHPSSPTKFLSLLFYLISFSRFRFRVSFFSPRRDLDANGALPPHVRVAEPRGQVTFLKGTHAVEPSLGLQPLEPLGPSRRSIPPGVLGGIRGVVKGEPRDFFRGLPRASERAHVDDRFAVGHVVQDIWRAEIDRDASCNQRVVHLLADVVVVLGVFNGDAKLVVPLLFFGSGYGQGRVG